MNDVTQKVDEWMYPFTTEHFIPYWKFQNDDDLRKLREEFQVNDEYIVYIADEDKWMNQWFVTIERIGDTIEDIYPETIGIRNIQGRFVNVWLYRCRIQTSE